MLESKLIPIHMDPIGTLARALRDVWLKYHIEGWRRGGMLMARLIQTRRERDYWIAGALIVVLYSILTYVVVEHIAVPGSDYYPHTDVIVSTLMDGHPLTFLKRSPYFGYHLVELPFLLAGLSVPQASAAACVVFNALSAAAVLWFSLRLISKESNPALPLMVAVVLLFVTALWLPIFNDQVYLGQGSPTIWHNPTYFAIKPFALITTGLFIMLSRDSFKSRKGCIWLSALIFVGVIMKPIFFQCFFPAVIAVYAIRKLTGAGMSFRAILVFLPSVIIGIIIVFLMFFYSSGGGNGDGGIALSFFGGWSKYTSNQWVSMLLLFAFPIYAVAVNWKAFLNPRSDWLVLPMMVIFGWLEYMVLVETGTRASHGNFGWAICIAVFLLWVYGLCAFANNTIQRDRPVIVLVVGWLLVAWHFVSGLYYVYYLLTSGAWL